jgi:probable F420-dependent oxidoreductase
MTFEARALARVLFRLAIDMKLGVALEGIRSAVELARLAARVEELGFDSLWTPDHVSYSQPICDPFQVLAVAAAATTRIRLGTGIYLLPLRHPTHVAKMAASLDWLCGGRLTLGVGVGGEFAAEFAACELPRAERDARADESIPVLRALWSGGDPPRDGRFFRVPRVSLSPPPLQRGGPPIWIGGRSDAALRRAARLGDGYLGYFLDAAGIRSRMERIRAWRGPAPIVCALMSFTRIERDATSALARARRRLGALYGPDTESAAARFGIVGTVETCQARVTEIAAAGVEHLLFSPITDGGDLEEQLEILAGIRG